MRLPPLALCLAILLPSCADDGGEETADPETTTSTSTTGDVSTSTGSTGEDTSGSDASSGTSTTDDPTTSSTSTTDDSSTTWEEPVCGDGIDGPGEACDGGGVDTPDCNADCTKPKCGDGHINEPAGEECDDENYVSNDGCTDECVVEYCGDGVVQDGIGEECEDGNDADFDGCSAECKVDKPCGEGFTTTWCQQAGLELDQYTRCESVSDDQTTCVNPEIKYGTNEGGIPIWAGSDEYMDESLGQWCASLGFSGLDAYNKGDRDCLQPYGAVVWSTGGDEDAKHWRDNYSDAKWYPPEKLNEANDGCDPGTALTEVTCAL